MGFKGRSGGRGGARHCGPEAFAKELGFVLRAETGGVGRGGEGSKGVARAAC